MQIKKKTVQYHCTQILAKLINLLLGAHKDVGKLNALSHVANSFMVQQNIYWAPTYTWYILVKTQSLFWSLYYSGQSNNKQITIWEGQKEGQRVKGYKEK